MPQVLKELMRHESIETTMKYYVGHNAQLTADALWSAYGQRNIESTPSSKTVADQPAAGGDENPAT